MRNQTNMTPDQEIKLKTATTWIPLGMVLTLGATLVYGAWTLSTERSQIYGQINQVSTDVQALAKTVDKLSELITRPNSLAFTRQEWIMDCLRAQIANPSWKCPYAEPASVHQKMVAQ